MKFLGGFLTGIIVFIAGGVLLALSGRVSVSAMSHGGLNDKVDEFLNKVSDASIARHAPAIKNPLAGDPNAAAAGMLHYRENCIDCHGAGAIDGKEFAKGLNPAPPMLDMEDVGKMTDGQLFWIVSNGIRATGMPAFSPTHKPDEIWSIVSFVRHIPKLSAAERAALSAGRGQESEHHAEAAKK
jgi:mono/diheme cytochrome c family protein